MNKIVNGLWIGSELSVMEQMSINSFLRHGHEYHLYVYDDVKYIPRGVMVLDAREVLPASTIFQYKHSKSYAGFANFFRYKLLLDKGGWWADTDVICLRPFSFPEEYVFASEEKGDSQIANNGIMKAPAGSPLLEYLCEVCRSKDPEQLRWGETGPRLLDEAARRFGLEEYIKPYRVFCPLGYAKWAQVLDASGPTVFDEETYAIHLWNEMWRRGEKDKNGCYDPGCLYEQLKKKYQVDKESPAFRESLHTSL